MSEIEITTTVAFDASELGAADIELIVDRRRKDIGNDLLAELFEERFKVEPDVIKAVMGGDSLAGWVSEVKIADEIGLEDNGDLQRAIDHARWARADNPRSLPDVLHYLTRAIPALAPLVPLLERETGRKLTP